MMKMVFLAALILAPACVASTAPDASEADAGPEAARACTGAVRTVLYARFWDGSTEVACADVMARARVVVGPMATPAVADAALWACNAQVNGDPALRQFTGVLVYDQAPLESWTARVVDATGAQLSVDTTVRHDEAECLRGEHAQFVSFVLTADHR